MDEILKILPKSIETSIREAKDKERIEEIRIGVGKKIRLLLLGKEIIKQYIATYEDIKTILQRISNYSLYAVEDELKQGYITINGGHRIGVAGQCVLENNIIKTIKHVSSINIRIAHEIIGCSDSLMKDIVTTNSINNTLIISPPRCGKTTLLRDISRNISNGYRRANLSGKRVVIIDERSEIAASYRGVPQMDVGDRTDVYDNCRKDEGLLMAIRTMSPEVVICDEIGSKKDIEGLVAAYNSGVNVICSLHGNSVEDLYNRDVFKEILKYKLIKKVIVLSAKHGAGSIEGIYDI